MRDLVTGGAGFIGSHLVENLLANNHDVKVLDNLSSGDPKNLEKARDNPNFNFIRGTLLSRRDLRKGLRDCTSVYHFAANPEVRAKNASPEEHFEQNIRATYNLLEAIRVNGGIDLVVFTSSSTVYGEPTLFPTPENYAPLKPISLYGASKLSGEALISAYSSMYGLKSVIFRLANIVGPRSNHGVIYDFIKKLEKNPYEFEVLGDGTQSKSYLYVSDCVKGILHGAKRVKEGTLIFNIGSGDRVNVLDIAKIVKEEAGYPDAQIKLTGGVDGGRGWEGDVKLMQLDISKLKNSGWEAAYGSAEAVRITARKISEKIIKK
jgi:UDP-glucose 4-epimerase